MDEKPFPIGERKKRPQIEDAHLKSRLRDASVAAGFDSLPEMLHAIAASGLIGELATAISEASTTDASAAVTFGDVSDVMLHKLAKTPPAERVRFWQELTPVQQGILIVRLRKSGTAVIEICDLFLIDEDIVTSMWSRYVTRIGDAAMAIPMEHLLGEMEVAADMLLSKAMKSGSVTAAWRIVVERFEMYQSLGLIERAPKKTEGSLEEQRVDEEFNSRVDLEVKKRMAGLRKLDNMKRAEATVRDSATNDGGENDEEEP